MPNTTTLKLPEIFRWLTSVIFAGYLVFPELAAARTELLQHTVEVEGHPMALWEKRASKPKGTILLLHGKTWSALPDFDLQVTGENLSFMDGLVEGLHSLRTRRPRLWRHAKRSHWVANT